MILIDPIKIGFPVFTAVGDHYSHRTTTHPVVAPTANNQR